MLVMQRDMVREETVTSPHTWGHCRANARQLFLRPGVGRHRNDARSNMNTTIT